MRLRRTLLAALFFGAIAVLTLGAAQFQQRRWAQYEREMQDPVEDPPDAWKDAEFTFMRLRYHAGNRGRFRSRWGNDANRSDRLFMRGLRRLTRIETRSVEEIVDIESDDLYNWPWAYAVSTGDWILTEAQGERLRNYFDRGGFLMVDDFHGERDWARFMEGIHKIYPNAEVVELNDDDAIFHTVYDLSERFQISGFQITRGYPYEKDGYVPHWRAVVDSQGRVQVAVLFNMDAGDAWQYSDYPRYPEKLAALAYRVGVNYTTYALTH